MTINSIVQRNICAVMCIIFFFFTYIMFMMKLNFQINLVYKPK